MPNETPAVNAATEQAVAHTAAHEVRAVAGAAQGIEHFFGISRRQNTRLPVLFLVMCAIMYYNARANAAKLL